MKRHVFVETNWVVDFASPAHHKGPSAVELLNRAKSGKLVLHIPLPCVTEARHPILTKCQPRREADAIRDFLVWATSSGQIGIDAAQTTRIVLDQFEVHVRREIKALDSILADLRTEANLDVFALNDRILHQCAELDGDLQPWDRDGNPKVRLIELYNTAHLWVYGDFELLAPERPTGWQGDEEGDLGASHSFLD